MTTRTYQAEPKHRFAFTKLTESQIGAKLAPAARSGPASSSALATSQTGNTLRIVTDKGPTLDYSFDSERELTLSENGSKPVKAGYGALELRQLVVFSHLIPDSQRGGKSTRAMRCWTTRHRPPHATTSPTGWKVRGSTGARTTASRRSTSTAR